MLGLAGNKIIQILLPVRLLPLTLLLGYIIPPSYVSQGVAVPSSTQFTFCWCEFLCVSGLTPPAIMDGSEIPALAHLLPHTFHLVATWYPVPVSPSSFTIGTLCIISRAFLRQLSCTLFSTPLVSAVNINPGALKLLL